MSAHIAMNRVPFDRVFESFFGLPVRADAPVYEWEETDTHYAFEFDVPGVKKEDVQIQAEADQLLVSGERKGARAATFRFALGIPRGVDAAKIEATQADGILRIMVAKPEAQKRRLISIQ